MSSTIASRRYARALLEVAEEGGLVEQVAKDLEVIRETLEGSRELVAMLKSPVIKGDTKSKILSEIFGELSEKTLLFISLLCKKKRASILPDVIEEFSALRDERGGIVNVDVTSAIELDDEQSKKLIDGLAGYTGKKVRAKLSLDKALLGGVTVKIGDTILDNSVRHQLQMLNEALTENA
jgi:F-type H+-transporting ATPase subunit delta